MMWSCFWWASGAADCVEYGKSRLPSVFLSRRHRQTKKNCMSASVVAAQGVVEFVFLFGSWSATTMTRFILHLYQRDYDLLIATLTSSIFHLYQRDPNLLVAILTCSILHILPMWFWPSNYYSDKFDFSHLQMWFWPNYHLHSVHLSLLSTWSWPSNYHPFWPFNNYHPHKVFIFHFYQRVLIF